MPIGTSYLLFMQSMPEKFRAAEAFLYELRNAGSKFSLGRMIKFAAALGGPQKKYPIIHVAGTNGKGSVCAMLESVMRGAGLKTGMFTSPHLVYLGERVQINRVPIPMEKIVERIAELREVADSIFDPKDVPNYPSFFEYMTVLAFDEFARQNVDCAVIEVGLGGALDSTNIVVPEISAITSIGLDHTQFLGDTIEKIAREKSGIIKDGVPVVCGELPGPALDVMRRTAHDKNAPFYLAKRFYKSDAELPETSLYGAYQRRNAAVAEVCAKILRHRAESGKSSKVFLSLDDAKIRESLKQVSWAARWQEIPLRNGARLILDSSHNEEGARALESNLSSMAFAQKPVIAVGVLGEERAVPLLKVVAKYARKIYLLSPNQPRALPISALRKLIPQTSAEIFESTVAELFPPSKSSPAVQNGETIISTGSIYLAGEVLASLNNSHPDNMQDKI